MYTVFIADDSDDLRTLLVRVFTRDPNFSVLGQAYDSESTLTGVKQFAPQLLLLDLSMPGIGGVNIVKELRKSNPDIKIAVLSGLPSENLKEATLVAGANLYLEKGTPLKEILAKVLNVLK